MSQSKDLQRRLRRIGGSKKRRLVAQSKPPRRVSLPPGNEIETKDGLVYRIDKLFPKDFMHGDHILGEVETLSPGLSSEIYRTPEF